jgi:hypothetical protein
MPLPSSPDRFVSGRTSTKRAVRPVFWLELAINPMTLIKSEGWIGYTKARILLALGIRLVGTDRCTRAIIAAWVCTPRLYDIGLAWSGGQQAEGYEEGSY